MVISGERVEWVKQVNSLIPTCRIITILVPKCHEFRHVHFSGTPLETLKFDLITDSDSLDLIPADPLRNVYFPSKDLEWWFPGERVEMGENRWIPEFRHNA